MHGTQMFDHLRSGLGDDAALDHLVCHVDHRLLEVAVLDAEDLTASRVVEQARVVVRIVWLLVLGQGPAKRDELLLQRCSILLEAR